MLTSITEAVSVSDSTFFSDESQTTTELFSDFPKRERSHRLPSLGATHGASAWVRMALGTGIARGVVGASRMPRR